LRKSCSLWQNRKASIRATSLYRIETKYLTFNSGKSTLVASLLRLIELQSGSIIVDGIDLSTIPRQEVRSRLITLPQEPFFLQASIRFNLDSTRQLSDGKLREALADVGLWDVIQTKGGLDAILTDDILSHGQRQLLCLVRAAFQNGKILILDEATSR